MEAGYGWKCHLYVENTENACRIFFTAHGRGYSGTQEYQCFCCRRASEYVCAAGFEFADDDFYLVVMIMYSPVLTLMGVTSVFLNLLLSNIISKKMVNIARVQLKNAGKLAGAAVAGIEMIETIKATGAENGFFEKWAVIRPEPIQEQ